MEQLADSEFDFVQQRCGQTLNFDACCKDESGSDSKCSDWSSLGKFLETDVAGNRIWLNAPFANMPAYIEHYLQCKGKDPQHTSACIVVPKAAGPWRHLLKGMELLHEYGKGQCMFVSVDGAGDVCSREAVQVYFDPPKPSLMSVKDCRRALTMEFDCAVSGVPGTALKRSWLVSARWKKECRQMICRNLTVLRQVVLGCSPSVTLFRPTRMCFLTSCLKDCLLTGV